MDIKKTFTDPKREQEGVWIDYHDDSRVKLARLPNPRYTKRLNALMKPYRDMQRRGTLPDDKENEILCLAISECILLDWDGFTDDGKPLGHSQQTAYKLLMASLDFRHDMVVLAGNEEHYKRDFVEAAEKNSETSSTGLSATAAS